MENGNKRTDAASITVLLGQWADGDEAALEELTPLVYEHLHRLAENAFRHERNALTLQPTAIVNEAYMQLARASVDWQGSGHFYALAARMMRRILVNHAKARRTDKRGGDRLRLTYDDSAIGRDDPQEDVLDLDEALRSLQELDPRKVEILELHYFAGLSYEETADALDISAATVKRDLRFGKAWIRKHLTDQQ